MKVGPLLVVLITLILKNYYVSFSFRNFIELLSVDLFLPGIILLLISEKKSLFLISSFAALWYFADALTIYSVNGRLTLSHIIEFGDAVNFYKPFLPVLLIFPFLIAVLFIKANIGRIKYLLGSLFILISISSNTPFRFYAVNPISKKEARRIDPNYPYSLPIELPNLELPGEPVNIVIILVEGFSAIYSGHYNPNGSLVPKLDKWAESGAVFENFFSNGDSTDMGVLSVLQGQYPFRRLKGGRKLYSDSSTTPGIIDQIKGYRLIRIDGAHTLGLRSNAYFESKGFEKIIDSGFDEWLPDSHVLDLSLKHLSPPSLIITSTMSTHVPFAPLRGEGGGGKESAWAYTDHALSEFLRELKNSSRWDDTVVAITGDHRAREPVSKEELTLFGDSAYNRVPLFILGGKLKSSRITSPSQQVDLIQNIFRLINGQTVISSPIIVVNRLQRGELSKTDGFTLFHDNQAFNGYIEGTKIFWEKFPPLLVDPLIHEIRSQPGSKYENSCPGVPSLINQSKILGVNVESITNKGNKSFILPNIDLRATHDGTFGDTNDFSAKLKTFLAPPKSGKFIIRFLYDDGICAWLDNKLLVQDWTNGDLEVKDVAVNLKGTVPLQIDYLQGSFTGTLRMFWREYGEDEWKVLDKGNFFLPEN